MQNIRPTPVQAFHRRQQVVTQIVTASSTSSAVAESKGFPVAVAVPALVGGMAAAIAGFLLFWWISKRRRREKRLRWERHQKRQARKRENASARPSISSNGRGHSTSKQPINEKAFVPPVPALPKHAASPASHGSERDYEHGYKEYDNYTQQPAIETPRDATVETPTEQISKPKKPSRSAARVAAAEQAAEASFGDINTRYQPKKPSPLALQAAEKAAEDARLPKWGDGPFRVNNPLPPVDTSRQVSGEWGVALGSPNTDGAYQSRVSGSYTNDPYLQDPRAKSGVYSHDPYAAYHDDDVEEVNYHQVAHGQGVGGNARRNWI